MIPTIEALEKEIEKFHSNISGSNALLEALENVVATAKSQNELFLSKTNDLGSMIEKLPPDIRSLFADSTSKLIDDIKAEHLQFQQSISTIFETCVKTISESETRILETPQQLEEKMTVAQQRFVLDISEVQARHISRLAEFEQTISDAQIQYSEMLEQQTKVFVANAEESISKLDAKYNAFVEKLESTNLDQVFQAVKSMKRSLNIKLNIIIGSAIAGLIATVLILIIK